MSRLPTMSQHARAMACPASEALPHAEQQATEVADEGTEKHQDAALEVLGEAREPRHPEWLDGLRESGALDALRGYIVEAALTYDVAFDDGAYLGSDLGRQYGDLLPTETAGSADYLLVKDEAVVVVDLKTGRHEVKVEENKQLLSLALAACRAHLKPRATVAILWAPEGMTPRWDWWDVSAERLQRHARELADALLVKTAEAREDVAAGRPPRHLQQGSHCHFCPAQAACPARSSMVRAASEPTYRAEWTAAVARGDTAGVSMAMKALRAEADEMERVLRAMARTGPVDVGDGRSLILRTVERESIDAAQAWPVLASLLGGEGARAAVTMEASKASVERGVRVAKAAGALKGSIKAGVEQVMEAVRQAGAVTTKTSERYEEK